MSPLIDQLIYIRDVVATLPVVKMAKESDPSYMK